MFLLVSKIPNINPNSSSGSPYHFPILPNEPYDHKTGESLIKITDVIVRPRITKRIIEPKLIKEIIDLLWKKAKILVDPELLEDILEDILEDLERSKPLKADQNLLDEILKTLK